MSTIPRRPRGWLSRRRESFWFVAFFAPNLLLLALFTYWPLLRNVYLSFHQWDLLSSLRPWVGLDNYQAVFQGQEAGIIFRNTFVFTVGSVGGTMVLGLLVALLLNQPLRGRTVARTVLFAPYVVSGVAIAIVWIFVFDPNFGLVQELFKRLGFTAPNWLRDPTWAMPAVIAVYVWKNLGYVVVIYLAGLQTVPKELYEAARVDGASAGSRFWHVTLPHLSPTLFFVFVTSVLASLQSFDIIKVMTDGGPVNATTTLIYQLYQEGFIAFRSGLAAAYAVVLFVIMIAITGVQLRFFERKVHYS